MTHVVISIHSVVKCVSPLCPLFLYGNTSRFDCLRYYHLKTGSIFLSYVK